jgi:hypothetical protein
MPRYDRGLGAAGDGDPDRFLGCAVSDPRLGLGRWHREQICSAPAGG